MGIKIAKDQPKYLLPIVYDTTAGIIQAHTNSLQTLATAALPAEDHSDEEPGFDDATCEVLYLMETQARSLVQILADLRSKVSNRPKPVAGDQQQQLEEQSVTEE
jgi:hypothetical protein